MKKVYIDRMEGLANVNDLNQLKELILILGGEWANEGFENEDIGEYFKYLIDKLMIKKKFEDLNKKMLSMMTLQEMKQIREEYVKKYIGDFDKPFGYKSELKNLDRLIAAKEVIKTCKELLSTLK